MEDNGFSPLFCIIVCVIVLMIVKCMWFEGGSSALPEIVPAEPAVVATPWKSPRVRSPVLGLLLLLPFILFFLYAASLIESFMAIFESAEARKERREQERLRKEREDSQLAKGLLVAGGAFVLMKVMGK